MGQIPMKLNGVSFTWHKIHVHFYLFIYLFPHDAWWVPIRYPSGIMRKKIENIDGLYFLKCPLAFYDLEGILWMH